MKTYKEGDYVVVKLDADKIQSRRPLFFPQEMKVYLGKTYRVKTVLSSDDPYLNQYVLDGVLDETDNYPWIWAAEWLEPGEPEKSIEIHENDLMDVFNDA